MDLVPFGRGGCRCTAQYTRPGPNKIHAIQNRRDPRGLSAEGLRSQPRLWPARVNHLTAPRRRVYLPRCTSTHPQPRRAFLLARVMLAACTAVLERTK